MTKKELKTVVDFYENVIMQQIIKPIECEEAYRIIKPDGAAIPYHQKMRAITIYVQGLKKEVLDGLEDMFNDFDTEQEELASTDDPRSKDYIPKDSAASPSIPDDTQSHKEDPTYIKVSEPLDEPMTELQRLEIDYEKATEANEKRSLKMRINKIKKDARNS